MPLQHLTLERCSMLPDLTLRELRVVGCSSITELPSFSRLPSLETLHIDGCDVLRELPTSIDALTALHTWALEFLSNLEALPSSISALTLR